MEKRNKIKFSCWTLVSTKPKNNSKVMLETNRCLLYMKIKKGKGKAQV